MEQKFFRGLRWVAVLGLMGLLGGMAGCDDPVGPGPSTPGICGRGVQTSVPDFGGEEPSVESAPGEFLIQFDMLATLEQVQLFNQEIIDTLEAVIEGFAPELGMQVVRYDMDVPVAEAIAIVQAFTGSEILDVIEPNYQFSLQILPDDPALWRQYGLSNTGQTGGCEGADIRAPEAWDLETGDPGVVVAVIDSGVDYTHPDLATNIWVNEDEVPRNWMDDDHNGYVDDVQGWNFDNGTNNPWDENKHGTHVAGIIGAVGDNGRGVAGVCWNVSLMPLKFIGSDGSGSSDAAIQAILYAVDNGARVISSSWGGWGGSQALEAAIRTAEEAGVLFIAAAGNNGLDNDLPLIRNYPSSYPLANIIAVAASADNDALASFTNYGRSTVDLAAPGVGIFSTVPGGGYEALSGTSMAAPFVAGVAALIWSREPSLSHQQVLQRILNNVDPAPSFDSYLSAGGRLNAHAALRGS